jgi:hypothetical protein
MLCNLCASQTGNKLMLVMFEKRLSSTKQDVLYITEKSILGISMTLK